MKSLVTSFALVLSAQTALSEPLAGVQNFDIDAPHHGRSMKTAIWYPAQQDREVEVYAENAVFFGTPVLRDAEPAAGQYPVVLLSHGLGGNIRSLMWLAAGLAERGALVVSVEHPNSSTFDFDMEAGLRHGTRAKDMSHVLDWMQASPFADLMASDVMAAGFSFGGWTALSLGGVRGNLGGYANSCAKADGRSSHCNDIARAGIDLSDLDEAEWNASYRDDRITHVAAIDPGLHWGLRVSDVEPMTAPVLLIGLGEGDDRLYATDFSNSGSGFEGHVPWAEIETLAPAAHFSMLPTCKPAGPAILEEEGDDPVCTDPDGTDRAVLHGQVIDLLAVQLGL